MNLAKRYAGAGVSMADLVPGTWWRWEGAELYT